jgi:hypothetical protein
LHEYTKEINLIQYLLKIKEFGLLEENHTGFAAGWFQEILA